MDFFPDWNEIELKVKVALFTFWLGATAVGVVMLFNSGIRLHRRTKTIVLAFSSFVFGLLLFMSMFTFDWASVLP